MCEYRYQGYHSPYYHEGHKKLRAKARKFVEEEIRPNIDKWLAYPTIPYRTIHPSLSLTTQPMDDVIGSRQVIQWSYMKKPINLALLVFFILRMSLHLSFISHSYHHYHMDCSYGVE
jgi:hypothetical protein